MISCKTLAIAAAFGLLAAGAAAASDWKKVDDPDQLRALYSNKTHHQLSYSREATKTHYRADGRALFVQGERRIPRTWQVKGNDQVCWSDDIQGQFCVHVERNRRNPNEIMIQQAGGSFGLVGGMVKIVDGIPSF
jgi:hypothetical protein